MQIGGLSGLCPERKSDFAQVRIPPIIPFFKKFFLFVFYLLYKVWFPATS